MSVVGAVCFWLSGFVLATTLLVGAESRRRILWNVRCFRGRRCASVTFGGVADGSPDPPAGTIVSMGYECLGCESHYKVSLLFGESGSYTVADRERITR